MRDNYPDGVIVVWIVGPPWEIISISTWFPIMPHVHWYLIPMGSDGCHLNPCILYIERPLFTSPPIQRSWISPDPIVVIAPEFEEYGHDSSNPLQMIFDVISFVWTLQRNFSWYFSLQGHKSISIMRLWPTILAHTGSLFQPEDMIPNCNIPSHP